MLRIEQADGPQTRGALAPLRAAVYPPEILAVVPWRDVESAPAQHRVLIFDGDVIVATAGWLIRDGIHEGLPVRIAGVGGVMVAPERQRSGLGYIAMQAAQEAFAENGEISFSMLFCEAKNVGFYNRLGWTVFDGAVFAEQAGAPQAYRVMTAMVRGVGSAAPSGGVVDVKGLPW